MQSYAAGLGRRIMRDVLRSESLLDLPTCDISITEFSVLNRSNASQLDFPDN